MPLVVADFHEQPYAVCRMFAAYHSKKNAFSDFKLLKRYRCPQQVYETRCTDTSDTKYPSFGNGDIIFTFTENRRKNRVIEKLELPIKSSWSSRLTVAGVHGHQKVKVVTIIV